MFTLARVIYASAATELKRGSSERLNVSGETSPISVGRVGGRCKIQLDAELVSGRRAELDVNEGGSRAWLAVTDLSTNGTWLDGVRMQKGVATKVSIGARICFLAPAANRRDALA